jgi:hypothetical protein
MHSLNYRIGITKIDAYEFIDMIIEIRNNLKKRMQKIKQLQILRKLR